MLTGAAPYRSSNSSIRHYPARAAAQVYSTARTVLPQWTASYLLSDREADSPCSSTDDPLKLAAPGETPQHTSVTFDVLRGRDVLIGLNGSTFTIFNVCDANAELQELCGYTLPADVISIKVSIYERSALIN